jgi:hypothetical protein
MRRECGFLQRCRFNVEAIWYTNNVLAVESEISKLVGSKGEATKEGRKVRTFKSRQDLCGQPTQLPELRVAWPPF